MDTDTIASRNVVDIFLREFGSGGCNGPQLPGLKGSDSEDFTLWDWSGPTIFKYESECSKATKVRYALATQLITYK